MKIKNGFFLPQTSSSICSVSGNKSLSFSHSPPLSLSIFRCFGANSVSNRSSSEKMKSIKGFDDAVCLYENMSRMRPLPSVVEFTQLLSRLVNLKDYSGAIYLFKDICNLGVSVNEYTMSVAINCYCLSNRVDYGFSIMGWFFKRGFIPNVFTFSTLLKGLFRANKINEAQELFRKIVTQGLCELNVVAYGTMIDGLCKAGNTTMAVELLRVMEKGTCKPNTHVYNMVIDGLCKDRMIDSALALFDVMSEKGILLMPSKVLKPDIVTYNSLLDGLFSVGRCFSALEFFDELQAVGLKPNFYTYCNMLVGLCKNSQTEQALSLVHALECKGEPRHISYYNILMDGFSKAKNLDVARTIFRDLPSKGVEPNVITYTTLIRGCCQNRLLEEVKDLLLKMERANLLPNEVTYNVIVQGFLREGEYDVAAKFHEEMDGKGFALDLSTFELLFGLFNPKEKNPTLFKMIQKFAPNTLKQKL